MSVDKKITVDELLVTPFSTRSEEEKSRIFSGGRPTPFIKLKGPPQDGGASRRERNLFEDLKLRRQKMFHTAKSMYDEIPWLTASAASQNFYCWPCLLFQSQVWRVPATCDISLLKTAVEDHKFTMEHLKAVCYYQMGLYQKEIVRKEDSPPECDKNSLDVVKRLTDVIFTVASMQLPPRDCDNYRSELDIKLCINNLQLLRKFDDVTKGCTDEAIDLLQNSAGFIVYLTKAIAKGMKLTIAREIISCKYVSIILNRHSNVKLKAQISTVLRYVTSGKVCERFVGFSHLFENATVESLYLHVTRIAQEFNIESKCIALSLDGAILTPNDASRLLIKCHTKLNNCVFVPCHSHTFDEVLQKSLSSAHTRFESFFKVMADFHACFWDLDSAFNVVFNRYLSRSKIDYMNISPRINGSGWCVASDFVICVRKHRQIFVSFLDEAASIDSTLSEGDITKALGFREFLRDFLTVFLLGLFSEIFHLTSTLNTALSNHSPERIVDKQMVLMLLHNLSAMREGEYERILARAAEEYGDGASKSNPDKCKMFRDTLKIVTEEVEMRYRYGHIDKFHFCRLFDFEEGGWFSFGETSNRYNELAQMFKIDHCLTQTLCEMETISKHKAFSKNSVYEFHQFLHASDFKHVFAALFDFSELILALPFKPASSTKDMSIKEKIDRWSFGSTHISNSADIDIIFIESDNLRKIQQSRTFYDQIVDSMKAEIANMKSEAAIMKSEAAMKLLFK